MCVMAVRMKGYVSRLAFAARCGHAIAFLAHEIRANSKNIFYCLSFKGGPLLPPRPSPLPSPFSSFFFSLLFAADWNVVVMAGTGAATLTCEMSHQSPILASPD